MKDHLLQWQEENSSFITQTETSEASHLGQLDKENEIKELEANLQKQLSSDNEEKKKKKKK